MLERVGAWLDTNGKAIYGTDGGASISFGNYDNFTRKGNTLYVHVYFWPGGTPAAEWLSFYQPPAVVAIGGVKAKALSARVLKTGQPIQFTQDEISLRLTGLSRHAARRPRHRHRRRVRRAAGRRPPQHPPPLAALQSRRQHLAKRCVILS